jgi:hypothetical protein
VSELSERHEVRVRGRGQTIVFVADSADGKLVIRQEPEGGGAADVCALTLKDPDELRAFFTGLRRIVSSLGYGGEAAGAAPAAASVASASAPPPRGQGTPVGGAPPPNRALSGGTPEEEREAIISQARQRNPQAFTPWTPQEEQEVRRRYEEGESIPSIARSRKRSQRAIELRLQRMGVL